MSLIDSTPTMFDEDYYAALYLYNTLIEYIYFLISLIQEGGPNSLDNISKYIKFYKKDVYNFIQIFKGKNLTEKVGEMLCLATTTFYIKDDILHLANNYLVFMKMIYEDLLVSKVVDLILRGISRVKDICRNINLNNIISIKEDCLVKMLKSYPYFYVGSDLSVVLLKFHGLVGLEKQSFCTTVNYFQSCVQSKMTLGDVKFHASCVPSCAMRNSLVVFCILYVSPYFKCKNGKVSLRNRLKKKHPSDQVIDLEKIGPHISSKSFPIGLLVHKSFGPVISNWSGEISHVSSCTGLIQAVVSLTNGHHGIFLVYFDKSALKFVCEVEDLKQFLNVCDAVEFDAEFCSQSMEGEVFWQAARVKVTRHALKSNIHELNLDVDGYIENVSPSQFSQVAKVCSVKNCNTKYTALEKVNLLNGITKVNNNSEHGSIFEGQKVKESRRPNEMCLHSNDGLDILGKVVVQSEPASDALIYQNSDMNVTFDAGKTCQIVSDENLNELPEETIQGPPNSRMDNVNQIDKSRNNNVNKEINLNDLKDENKCLNMNTKVPKEILGDIRDIKVSTQENKYYGNETQKSRKECFGGNCLFDCEPNKVSDEILNKLPDGHYYEFISNMSKNSTFLFGEVTFLSTCDGIAESCYENKLCQIFFKKSDICFQNGAGNIMCKGSTVLFYIPYVELDEQIFMATLAYPLTAMETKEVGENGFNARDFIVNHFSKLVKKSLNGAWICDCDILKNLLIDIPKGPNLKVSTDPSEMYLMVKDNFHGVCQMSAETYKKICSLMCQLYSRNVKELNVRHFIQGTLLFLKKSEVPCKSKTKARKYSLNSKKQRHQSWKYDPTEGNLDNSKVPRFNVENDVPNILIDSGNGVENCQKDTSYTANLNMPNKYLTNVFMSEQNRLRVSSGSCSSVCSFSSCLDDLAKDGSDDIFYSCESDLSADELPVEEDTLFKNKKSLKEINDISFLLMNTSKYYEKSDRLQEYSSKDNKIYCSQYTQLWLKPRHRELKHKNLRKKNNKLNLTMGNKYCKVCHKPPIETSAEVTIISNNYIYFKTKNDCVTLAFPRCFIPSEVKGSLKLNMVVKLKIVPHPLLNVSQVMSVNSL